jgi:anti-sigma B factor antagonist
VYAYLVRLDPADGPYPEPSPEVVVPHPFHPAPGCRAVVAELRLVPPQASLVLAGELDLHTAAQLRAALQAIAVAPVSELVVDLSEVEFASLSALGELVDAARAVGRRGGTVLVRGVRPLQRRVFALLAAPETLVVAGDDMG